MDNRKALTDYPLLIGILITVIFSIILSLNTILKVWDICVNAGLPDILIYLSNFSVRFLSGAIVVILIIPLIFYFSRKHLSFKDYFKDDIQLTKGISVNKTILAGIISPLCYFIIAIFVASVLGVLNIDFDIILRNPDINSGHGWFIFFYAIIPALWEEIIFRGVILNTVKAKYSDNSAILISSLLFGLFHVITSILVNVPLEMVFFYFIMSTLFGLTWGYMVIKSKSLLPSILAHYIIDAFGYAFITIDSNADQSIAGPFFMLTTLLYPLITIIMAKYFLKNSRI